MEASRHPRPWRHWWPLLSSCATRSRRRCSRPGRQDSGWWLLLGLCCIRLLQRLPSSRAASRLLQWLTLRCCCCRAIVLACCTMHWAKVLMAQCADFRAVEVQWNFASWTCKSAVGLLPRIHQYTAHEALPVAVSLGLGPGLAPRLGQRHPPWPTSILAYEMGSKLL